MDEAVNGRAPTPACADVALLLAGLLPEAEAAAAVAHRSSCPACQEAAAQLGDEIAGVTALDMLLGARAEARLREGRPLSPLRPVYQPVAPVPVIPPWWRQLIARPVPVLAGVAAVLLLLLGSVAFLGNLVGGSDESLDLARGQADTAESRQATRAVATLTVTGDSSRAAQSGATAEGATRTTAGMPDTATAAAEAAPETPEPPPPSPAPASVPADAATAARAPVLPSPPATTPPPVTPPPTAASRPVATEPPAGAGRPATAAPATAPAVLPTVAGAAAPRPATVAPTPVRTPAPTAAAAAAPQSAPPTTTLAPPFAATTAPTTPTRNATAAATPTSAQPARPAAAVAATPSPTASPVGTPPPAATPRTSSGAAANSAVPAPPLVLVPPSIASGGMLTVSARTTPGASCGVGAGALSATALPAQIAPRIADAGGAVSWSFTVAPVAPGRYPVAVTCNGVTGSATVTVGG